MRPRPAGPWLQLLWASKGFGCGWPLLAVAGRWKLLVGLAAWVAFGACRRQATVAPDVPALASGWPRPAVGYVWLTEMCCGWLVAGYSCGFAMIDELRLYLMLIVELSVCTLCGPSVVSS